MIVKTLLTLSAVDYTILVESSTCLCVDLLFLPSNLEKKVLRLPGKEGSMFVLLTVGL